MRWPGKHSRRKHRNSRTRRSRRRSGTPAPLELPDTGYSLSGRPERNRRRRIIYAQIAILLNRGAQKVARKTVRLSDISGHEIPYGKGALVPLTCADARGGSRELDVTDAEAEKLGGRQVVRRGRKPKAA